MLHTYNSYHLVHRCTAIVQCIEYFPFPTTVAAFSQAGHTPADVEGEIYRSTSQLDTGIITDKSVVIYLSTIFCTSLVQDE